MKKNILNILNLLLSNPGFFFNLLINKYKNKIDEIQLFSSGLKKIIKFNYLNWPLDKSSSTKYILIDSIRSPEIIIPYIYFSNILSKIHNAKIASFSEKQKQNNSELRKSFNCKDHIYIKLNKKEDILKKNLILKDLKKSIKNKKDVFEINIYDINCGIDIYETYLRKGYPTVNINNPLLWEIIERAIEICIFWTNFFDNNEVVAILPSHDVYIDYNIIIKIAQRKNIPVYMASLYNFQLSTEPHSLYKNRFNNYKKYYENLSTEEKKEALKISSKQIKLRLSGKVGVDITYSTKSSFNPKNIRKNNVLKKSKNLKVLICTHCFFDNPHAYGSLLFIDFYEWIKYLGNISNKTDYDWYIKPHPDYLPGTIQTIKQIIKKYPKIQLISPKVSFHQLIEEGITNVLTCYGSVGHELAFLGVNVINAGLNPHVNFDFNEHPSTLEEYKKIIMNLKNLKIKVQKEEIYKFYYIHYYYTYLDNLFFKSLKEFKSKNLNRNKIYEYFVNNIDQKKHKEIIHAITDFIKSGKRNYFLKGPEN